MGDLKYKVFRIAILLLFLQSMYAWVFWGLEIVVVFGGLFFALFFAFFGGLEVFSVKRSNIIPIIILFGIEIYVSMDNNTNGVIITMAKAFIISIVLLLKDSLKIDLFQYLTKYFSYLLLGSIIGWLLHQVGAPLPSFEISYDKGRYVYDNYLLFIDDQREDLLPLPRFSSVFLEPGQLGMITAFFLCANRFELKRKSVLIIFIATIITFSLAAYLLVAISSIIYLILDSKRPTRNTIILIITLIGLTLFFKNYKNGDNIVNNAIFMRLETNNQGTIEGDNRFTEEMDIYFEQFVDSKNYFYGVGSESYASMFLGANAGYKVYLVQFGVLGTLLTFIFYFSLVVNNQTKMAWILFLIYIICFLQAAYPLWASEIILFATALAFFRSYNTKMIPE